MFSQTWWGDGRGNTASGVVKPLERRTTLFHVVAIGLIERSQVRKAEFTNIGMIPTIMDRK